MADPTPLRDRVAVVTGVSRRAGIGYAVARRLARLGASLFLHHYPPWGDEAVLDGVAEVLVDGARIAHGSLDLSSPSAPATLIETAASALGHLDILVCNHARSGSDGPWRRSTRRCWTRTGR